MNPRQAIDSCGIMKNVLIPAMFAAALAYPQQAVTVSHSDAAFLKDGAEGGMDEVKLGELALQNGVGDRVKQFGQRMVDDHTKMNNELQPLAARKHVTLPTDISVRQHASYKLLSAKSGEEFDKSYISSMVKDHEEDIAAFQKEASNGTDADVKALASKALPTLQEHLRMAQDIARELGVK
jgi:putative membrane protein